MRSKRDVHFRTGSSRSDMLEGVEAATRKVIEMGYAAPNVGHHLGGVANQRDLTVRFMEFFDHYLKGAPVQAWLTDGVPFLKKDASRFPLLAWPSPHHLRVVFSWQRELTERCAMAACVSSLSGLLSFHHVLGLQR